MGSKKYKYGFVLGGGGARGFSHLGAIQALIEKGIKPDVISGVSAGSIAGAFLASGLTQSLFSIPMFLQLSGVSLSTPY